LRVTADTNRYLRGPFLFENQQRDYAHISADGYLRRCSYTGGGVALKVQPILAALRQLSEQESCTVGGS
jgi:hypothetical protein